jgi:hypothetical protein
LEAVENWPHVERFISRVGLARETRMLGEEATNGGIRRFLLVLILMYGVLDCTISLDLIISHLIMSRSSSSLVSLLEFGCCCESGPKELTLCCDLHLELPSAAWEISVGVGVGEKELGTTGTVMQNARFSLIAMRNTEK